MDDIKISYLIKIFLISIVFIFNNSINFSKLYSSYADSANSSGEWLTGITQMPTARTHLKSVEIGGKIYCIGGNTGSLVGTLEVYDVKTNKWETKTSMPNPTSGFGVSVVDGKIYCIGGASAYNIMQIYNPVSDTWVTKAGMPTGRVNLESQAIGSKIYCIGGQTPNANVSNIVEIYDTENDSWSTGEVIPNARCVFSSSIIGNKIYCIGGYDASKSVAQIDIYDTELNRWETKGNMPNPRRDHTATVVGDSIYVIGGYDGGPLFDSVDVYNTKTNEWESKAEMPTGRRYPVSVTVNDAVYVIGGSTNSNTKLDAVEIYIPKKYEVYLVDRAEISKNMDDVKAVRGIINRMEESNLKNELQARLNVLFPDITLDRKNTTSNLDIYIKSENMLSMSLDTNSITFDNYSGAAPIELQDAVNITINSSLPYDLNAYMPTEISNSDGSNKINLDIFNIKESSESNYQQFVDNTNKIVLKSNCNEGNNINHKIDLKLDSNSAYQADVYKAVIRFEAIQK